MSLDIEIRIGGILSADGREYRVFYVSQLEIGLCRLGTSTTDVVYFDTGSVMKLVQDGVWSIGYNDTARVVDEDSLTKWQRDYYIKRKNAVDELIEAYGPSFKGLVASGLRKPEYKEICARYGLSREQSRKMVHRFLQSGLKYSSLLPEERVVTRKEATTKVGRKALLQSEAIVTDDVKGFFAEAIDEYKSNPAKSLKDVYQEMKILHYCMDSYSNGEVRRTLMPQKDIPTFRQFYYYYSKTAGKKEVMESRLTARKVRNDSRVLTGTSGTGVRSAGDMAELDAKECDVSLVSSLNGSVTIGRPILYILIDVKTCMIMAMSVAFDNNSYIGVTNLFLNLAEDKQKYAEKYGIQVNDPATWPSGFKPAAIRTDRGSEDISKEFSRVCAELHIEKHTAPPATGSLKGLVERFFHEIDSQTNPYTEGHGRIKKEYGSKHHEQATLTIDEFTRIAIACVLQHNTRSVESRDIPGELKAKGVNPAPYMLWDHYCREYGQPRVIGDRQQYLWTMMHRGKAKLRKNGIDFNGLNYRTDDPDLIRRQFAVGKRHEDLEVRFDPRDASYIFLQSGGNVKTLTLNTDREWEKSCVGMTFKEVDDIRQIAKVKALEQRRRDDELDIWRRDVVKTTVDDSKTGVTPSKKGMRQFREIEKQAVAAERSFASEAAGNILPPVAEEISEIEEIDADDEFDSMI